MCEYFRRTWTPGFVEGSQCAVFLDPFFLVTKEVDKVEFLVMKFCIFTHILYKIELNAHVEK